METKERVIAIIRKVCMHASVLPADHGRPLQDLGIDSLDLSGILLEIEEAFGIKIPDQDIARLGSINAIADYLSSRSTVP